MIERRSEPFGADVADFTPSAAAPRLTRSGLTWLLAAMCLVPIVTIIWLFRTLPPVYENQLQAAVSLENVPPAAYYDQPVAMRAYIPTAALVVRNLGHQPWTNINVRVNQHYQIYEHQVPFEAGAQRGFLLDRFVTRTGAVLDLRLVQIHHVEIYARLPSGARATFEHTF